MALVVRSFNETYQDYKNEAQARQELLTDWNDGSINDVLAGASATAVQEILRILQDRFALTFIGSAEGDDLEFLATDHFGDKFARPDATQAVGIVEFTRPNADAGNVLIPSGTIVKTAPDANGTSQRFETILPVTMTGTSISASIIAITAGQAGNVESGFINIIETALTDFSIIVTNPLATAGGELEEDDPAYRETIYNLIQTLKGATCSAIQAAAEEVPGVEQATSVEFVQVVIEWDQSTSMPVGSSFKIARGYLYIADANGSASQALIDNVNLAIEDIRACGVHITVLPATSLSLNWKASIQLNPSGPNYASLSLDDSPIINTMTQYVQDLATGGSFIRNLARKAILDVWGPDGSDDLVDFVTSVPTGDVVPEGFEKLVPGTVEIV